MVELSTDENGRHSRRAFLLASGACAVCSVVAYRVGYRAAKRTSATSPPGEPGSPSRTRTQRAQAQPDALFRVRTAEPIVALTFDDGPDPLHTPYVLDLLRRASATATFFQIGVNAQASPSLVQQVQSGGHSIGNHTFDHRELELLSDQGVQTEIEKGQRALIGVGVPRPTMFRPPKGYTDEVVGVLADIDRYRTVFWDACVEAFVDHRPVAEGVSKLLERVGPGSIILAHDGGTVVGSGRTPLSRARTMQALPLLLDGLHRKGLEVVDVPTLLSRAKLPLLPRPPVP